VADPKERPLRRSDGEQTHATILEAAVRLASVEGLGALTLGRLAQEVGVSKSGVYAHFGSKQQLQLDILATARDIFGREVIEPAYTAPGGLPRLEAVCESYLSYIERWVFPGGCFFAGMLAEFDAQTDALHDDVAADQREWIGLLESLAAEALSRGELASGADVEQLVFDLTAAVTLANHYYVLFRDPAVIDRARTSIRDAIARALP
jgi:AcrR family transcriptional regulator